MTKPGAFVTVFAVTVTLAVCAGRAWAEGRDAMFEEDTIDTGAGALKITFLAPAAR